MSSYVASMAAFAEKHLRKVPKTYLDKIIFEIRDLAHNPSDSRAAFGPARQGSCAR